MATNIISGTITTAINLTSAYYLDPVTNTGTISLASAGIALGAATNWTVVNTGHINTPSGATDYGISLGAGGSISNAGGAVVTGGFAAAILHGAGTITNSGVLAGLTDEGALLGDGGFVSNAAGATISGNTHAVLINNAAGTVINDGTITDVTKGSVVLLDGGSVTNGSAGIVRQSTDAIYVSGATGSVVNYGFLYASTGHAIELDAGGIATNALHGTLEGQHAAFYSSSTVSGATIVTLVNAGYIETSGTTSSAVALQAAGGTVTNESTGTINGASHAVFFRGGSGTLVNDGLLTSSLGGVVDLFAGGFVSNESSGMILGTSTSASPIYVTGGSGIVINQGLIDTPSRAAVAFFSGGTVQDYASGTIAGHTGIYIKGGAGTVQTRGTIIGTDGTAVALAPGFANRVDYNAGAVFEGVVNGGNSVLSPTQSTLRLEYYSAHPVGTLTNLNSTFVDFAQISVKGDWVFTGADSLLANVTLTDSSGGTDSPAGTIGGYGLNLGGFDAVTVDPGAVVSRASTGITHTAGIYASGTANNALIVNYGTITNPTNSYAAGIALFDGGTVVNHVVTIGTAVLMGTIAGHDVGIYTGGGGFSTVINAGMVEGLNDTGVELKNGGTVNNLAGGSIVAPKNGVVLDHGGTVVNAGAIVVSGVTNNAQGVYLNFGGAVTNLAGGTISGQIGIYGASNFGPLTIVDAGTIEGSYEAIQFQTGSGNVLIIDPGAYIKGAINGANGDNSGLTTSVEFAAGQGSFNAGIAPISNVGQITIESGGSWVVAGYTSLDDTTTVHDLGDLKLTGKMSGHGVISLGSNATLAFSPLDAPTPTISGLATNNTIEIVGGAYPTSLYLQGNQLTAVGTGVTLTVATSLPGNDFIFITHNSNTYIVACFATGTSILTAGGPRAVEALCPGDVVITATGRLAAIRWIGHRRTELRRHPSPHDVMPVRVRAGAFGPGLPLRDLVLSPDHAVLVEGKLVPVRHLVNGVSIVQETRDAITYWHVELDRHDIVLAEGMPCETFLDTGNRAAFENAEGPMELHPEFSRRVWAEQGCAPILVDPAAAGLRAIHTKLLALARDLPIAPVANVSA
jgi:hypothetical protein